MYLSPLNILYTTGVNDSDELITDKDVERKIKSFKEKRSTPKLQVFYKEGHYFTLNNAELRVCRKLQNDGYCHRIRVESVPIKRIPKGILEMMVIPEQQSIPKTDTNKRSKRGYRPVSCNTISNDPDMTNNKTDDDSDSILSCSVKSSDDEVSEDDLQDAEDTDDWVSSSDESTESEVDEEEESFI